MKNLLRTGSFRGISVEQATRDVLAPVKNEPWAKPWIATFAGKLMETRTGIIFASPYVPKKAFPDEALARYSQNVTVFFRQLNGAERLFVLHDDDERRAAGRMFGTLPSRFVYIFKNRLDAVALLEGKNRKSGIYYSPQVVQMARDFTDKCASFLVAGSLHTAKIVQEGLYIYLVRRGMQQKGIALDPRFLQENV